MPPKSSWRPAPSSQLLFVLLAGGLAAYSTKRSWLLGAGRQLLFGGIAVAATYTIGTLLGVSNLG